MGSGEVAILNSVHGKRCRQRFGLSQALEERGSRLDRHLGEEHRGGGSPQGRDPEMRAHLRHRRLRQWEAGDAAPDPHPP